MGWLLNRTLKPKKKLKENKKKRSFSKLLPAGIHFDSLDKCGKFAHHEQLSHIFDPFLAALALLGEPSVALLLYCMKSLEWALKKFSKFISNSKSHDFVYSHSSHVHGSSSTSLITPLCYLPPPHLSHSAVTQWAASYEGAATHKEKMLGCDSDRDDKNRDVMGLGCVWRILSPCKVFFYTFFLNITKQLFLLRLLPTILAPNYGNTGLKMRQTHLKPRYFFFCLFFFTNTSIFFTYRCPPYPMSRTAGLKRHVRFFFFFAFYLFHY